MECFRIYFVNHTFPTHTSSLFHFPLTTYPTAFPSMSSLVPKLQALGDIQIAMKVLSGGTEGEPIHPIDRHYHGLKCQLSPLDSEDDTFR